MISAIIVYGTLSGVVIFSLLYLLRPSWRESVEQPKRIFQQQLEAYDQQQDNGRSVNNGS
jgi:hypothetical protein